MRRRSLRRIAGLFVGMGGALAATRSLGGLLFGVAGTDPATYAVVTGVLLAAGVVACWLPGAPRRADEPAGGFAAGITCCGRYLPPARYGVICGYASSAAALTCSRT